MKICDYIVDFLVKSKVKHAFGITGGSIVYVFDALGRNPNIKYICNHHEQASAMAADGYSRISGNLGVGIATSGPGATNLLTGVCCSYFDSTPTLFITGQVSTSQLKGKSKVRQVGFQEIGVVKTFKPNTKYAKLVTDPKRIRYELEKATYLAKNGRPGPVLLDIPEDIQKINVNPDELASYKPRKLKTDLKYLEEKVSQAIKLLEKAERPIVILGNGVRLAYADKEAQNFIKSSGLPVALTWAALDLFPSDYALSVRDFGITANKPGNLAVQNSDLILAIGTRLDTHEIGTCSETLAPYAKKIIVDVDASELEKHESIGIKNLEILVNCDSKEFIELLSSDLGKIRSKDRGEWNSMIWKWKKKFPQCPQNYFNSKNQINPYVFVDVLSSESKERDIIIPEAGCNVTWTMQAWKVKDGQRLFTSYNHSPMGYGIPASIGACFANDSKPVSTIIGDGGLMMNEQELATIVKHNLPIKIFVMNNKGYGMIRQTQRARVNGRYEACSEEHFHIPDPKILARAHGFRQTETIENHSELQGKIRKVLSYDCPVLCDVKIYQDSDIHQKVLSGEAIDKAPLD